MPRVKAFDETEVLKKAVDLFWEKGYCATSIQNLVNHLGINRASLYDTYGGKQALFNKALAYYRHSNIEELNDFLGNYPIVKEGIRAFFDRGINIALNDKNRKGCFVVNTTIELMSNDETMRQTLAANKQHFQGIFYKYLKRGESEGQFPKGKNLEAIATMIFIFQNGLQVVSKINPEPIELQNNIDLLVGMLD